MRCWRWLFGNKIPISMQVLFIYLEDCSDLTRRFGAFEVMAWINKVYSCLDQSAPRPSSSSLLLSSLELSDATIYEP